MLSISLYYILYRDRIYDLLYVILYLYGLLHISISPKLPFRRATASDEREKRRKDSEGGRGSRKQTLGNEEVARIASRRARGHLYPFRFGWQERLIVRDSRVLGRVESLLREIGGATSGTTRRNERRASLYSTDSRFWKGERRGEGH